MAIREPQNERSTVSRSRLPYLVWPVVALLMAGCFEDIKQADDGGGDTLPPTITGTTPTDGATGVAINTSILVTFSEAMDAAATEGAFSISPTVTGTFAWAGSGTVLTFTPSANLSATTTYTVTVGTGASELAGNPLSAAYTFSFTTGGDGGTWETKAPMPTGRIGLSCSAVNGIIYAIGGQDGPNLDTVEAYDPATDSWSAKSPMPTPAAGLSSTVIDNRIYVIDAATGGLNSYDPLTDTWAPLSSAPNGSSDHCSAAFDRQIYMIGGNGPNQIHIYDPDVDSWTSVAGLPTPTWQMACTVLDQEIFVIGGCTSVNCVPDVYSYDPIFAAWTTRADLAGGIGRFAHTCEVVLDRIYCIGGFFNDDTIEAYDATSDSWGIVTNIPTPRNDHGSAVVGGTIYVIGGNGGMTTVEAYTPSPP